MRNLARLHRVPFTGIIATRVALYYAMGVRVPDPGTRGLVWVVMSPRFGRMAEERARLVGERHA